MRPNFKFKVIENEKNVPTQQNQKGQNSWLQGKKLNLGGKEGSQ